MGRFYTASFQGAAVTAAVDVFEVLAASGKPFILHEVIWGQTSDSADAQAEQIRVDIKKATGSYTSGSGGSTATLVKHLTNDASAGPTPETNNTTQASTGSGAVTTIRSDVINVQAGYQYLPTPETRILFLPTEACIVSITAPADSLTTSASITIEEL